MFHVDKIQIRTMTGPFEDMTRRNLAIFQTNDSFFDISEIERSPEDLVIRRRPILLFEIFEISVLSSNRLVIQAFEKNSSNNYLMYLHCDIAEPVNDGISKMVQSYRMLKGISDLPVS